MDPQHPIEVSKIVETLSSQLSGSSQQQPAGSSQQVEIPSNPIIAQTLHKLQARTGATIPTENLSPTGQAIGEDIKKTLKDTETLLEEKNRDELLQKVSQRVNEIQRLRNTEAGRSAMDKMVNLGEEKGEQVQTIFTTQWREQGLAEKLYNLTKNLISSTEFRDLVIKSVSILQEAFSTEDISDVRERMDVETKTFSEAAMGEGKEVVSGGKQEVMSQESKQRLFDRFIALLRKLQRNPEYQETINGIISQVSLLRYQRPSWEEQMQNLNEEERQVINQIKDNVSAMSLDLKQLVEKFVNGSVDDAVQTWSDLTSQIKDDKTAHSWIENFSGYVTRCLQDSEYIQNTSAVRSDGERLFDEANDEIVNKYRPGVEHFLTQLRYYLDRMRRDPLTKKLTGDFSALTSHLFYDAQGNPTLKPELLTDLQTIIPAVLRNLRYLKVPDIIVQEPGMNFIAKDIVINVGELAPHHLKLTVTSDIPEGNAPARNIIDFEMSRIHAEAKDIIFAIDKSGIPPLTDSGLVDMRIFEDGMQVYLRMEPVISRLHAPEEVPKITAGLQVVRSECRLEHFDLNVHGSGHDWMYFFLGPYIRRTVRQRIEEAVTDYFLKADLTTTLTVPETVAPPQSQAYQSFQSQSQFESQSQAAV